MGHHDLFHGKSWEMMVYFIENHGKSWFISWKIMGNHGLFHGKSCEIMVYFMVGDTSK